MNERLEAIVSGRVQMVMYRDFTARFARRLGLVGEVKNLSDGTVRVIAEGSRRAYGGTQSARNYCWKGNLTL